MLLVKRIHSKEKDHWDVYTLLESAVYDKSSYAKFPDSIELEVYIDNVVIDSADDDLNLLREEDFIDYTICLFIVDTVAKKHYVKNVNITIGVEFIEE